VGDLERVVCAICVRSVRPAGIASRYRVSLAMKQCYRARRKLSQITLYFQYQGTMIRSAPYFAPDFAHLHSVDDPLTEHDCAKAKSDCGEEERSVETYTCPASSLYPWLDSRDGTRSTCSVRRRDVVVARRPRIGRCRSRARAGRAAV
jgi:hypothetical protein